MKKKDKVVIISDKYSVEDFYKNLIFYKLFNKNKEFHIKYDIQISEEIQEELEQIIRVLNKKSKKERLGLIFDLACEQIDKLNVSQNFCEFKNNKCFTQKSKEGINGCCGQCRYLINGNCTQNSIACKLYYCYKIKKNKKCPKINDINILKYFLNPKEKFVFSMALYENKEETIKSATRSILFKIFTPIKKNK